MDVEGYLMPEDLYYHEKHMWLKIEGDKARVGITDFAQKLAGEISYIELPIINEDAKKDEVVGTLETGKWVGKIHAPISGKITSANKDLENDPTIVNQSPYERGWIFEMTVKDKKELEILMQGEKAVEWIKKEIEKQKKK